MQSGPEDTLEERYAIKFCFKLGKNATKTYRMLQTAFGPSCRNRASVLSGLRDSKKARRLWWMMSKEVDTPQLIGQRVRFRVRIRVTILRFIGSSGRDSVGRSQPSSNRVSGISTRTMHLFTTPSLSQTIWPRLASRQFLSLPLVQTLLPVTFAYSLSLEAVVMRQLRR